MIADNGTRKEPRKARHRESSTVCSVVIKEVGKGEGLRAAGTVGGKNALTLKRYCISQAGAQANTHAHAFLVPLRKDY